MAWLFKSNQQDLRNLAANLTISTIHIFGYSYVLSWLNKIVYLDSRSVNWSQTCDGDVGGGR